MRGCDIMKNMKRSSQILLYLLFLVISCCTFPTYNFTKDFGKSIVTTNLILNVLCYYELGKFEKLMQKDWKIGKVLLVNMGVILLGMVMRFFLEFGEVSNTYNFTGPNIAIHITAALVISFVSYLTFTPPTPNPPTLNSR